MSLPTPDSSVEKLQAALQAKAKAAPGYRFYTLWDKVCRPDVLAEAYRRCRANGGAPGVDGQTFEQIESAGVGPWLAALREELRRAEYRPQPLLRVWIPKGNGGQRPLGIPMVRAYCSPYQEPWGWSPRRWPGATAVGRLLGGNRGCRSPAYLATVTSTTGSASGALSASASAR